MSIPGLGALSPHAMRFAEAYGENEPVKPSVEREVGKVREFIAAADKVSAWPAVRDSEMLAPLGEVRDQAAKQLEVNARIGAWFLELADGEGLAFKDLPVDTGLLGAVVVKAFGNARTESELERESAEAMVSE
jgi:hypothetical protein